MIDWYYADDSRQRRGPLSAEAIAELFRSQRIAADTLVWREGLGNWLPLAICVALPLPALLRRIRVEEAELTRVLGEPYRAYQTRTKRLIPGVW